jgi:hypothetical protein
MKKILTIIVLAGLAVGLVNCGGNTEKKNVIKFLTRSTEIMKTDEYKKTGNFEEMTNKVLSECNFTTYQDFDIALKKYSADEEVAAAAAKYAEIQGGSQK